MSRERARVHGPGFRASKRQLGYSDQLRMREMREQTEAPLPKRTLAERVLPWRRKKRRQHEEGRAEAARRWQEIEKDDRVWHTRRRRSHRRGKQVRRDVRHMHRRGWMGIFTLAQRERLAGLGRYRRARLDADFEGYEHPQQRRLERMLRSDRTDDARVLAAETGLQLKV